MTSFSALQNNAPKSEILYSAEICAVPPGSPGLRRLEFRLRDTFQGFVPDLHGARECHLAPSGKIRNSREGKRETHPSPLREVTRIAAELAENFPLL
jgi:hypothetical protein